jgi:hypothetical protein
MGHPFQSRVPTTLHKWLKIRSAEEGVSLKQMSSNILSLFVQQQPWQAEGFFFQRCPNEDSTILFFFPEDAVSEMIRAECERRGTSISVFVYTATDWYLRRQEKAENQG